jgi:hypothetical protein
VLFDKDLQDNLSKEACKMKKQITIFFIVTLVLMLLVPNLVYGQVGINKGIKVGLNLATLGGDDADTYGSLSNRTGISAGGFVVLNLAVINIRPEILYTMKGVKAELNTVETTMKLDYLEIPVLLEYNLPLPGPVSPCIFAGPAFAFKLSAKAETGSQEVEMDSLIKSTDLGLVIGAGVTLNNMITVDVRYVLGLSSIDDSPVELDVKNQVISLMVGYMF